MKTKKVSILYFCLICLLLYACQSDNPNLTIPSPSPSITPSPPASPTRTGNPTITITPSLTHFPTRTPTPSRTPTLTPSPIDFSSLEIFSPENANRIIALQGHFVNARGLQDGLSVSPDGRLLAVSDQQAYTIWDVSSGQIVRRITDAVGELKFTPDGRYLTGWLDGLLTFWDVEDWSIEKTLKLEPGIRNVLGFSSDSKYIAVSNSENSIDLWDLESGEMIQNFTGHSDWLTGLFFTPDKNYLISGSFDDTIRVWDISTGMEIRSMFGDQITVSPDGGVIASRTSANAVTLWDTETGQEIRKLIVPENLVIPIAFSHDGRILASGNKDGTLTLWNTLNGELIRTLSGYSAQVWQVAFSPEGRLFASVNLDGLVIVWGVPEDNQNTVVAYDFPPTPTATATINLAPDLQNECTAVLSQLMSPENLTGRLVLDSRMSQGGFRAGGSYLLDIASCEVIPLPALNEIQTSFSVSPNRTYLAYENVTNNGKGVILKMEYVIITADGKEIARIPAQNSWYGLDWLNDQYFAVGISESTGLFDPITGPSTLFLLNPFSGEQRTLSPDYPDFYFENATGVTWWSIDNYDPSLTRVVYPRFDASGDEYSYALWDMQNDQLLKILDSVFSFPNWIGLLPAPHWSPDGSQVVIQGVNSDFEFELYSVHRDGQVDKITQLSSTYFIDERNVSWSPDGRYLAMLVWPKELGVFSGSRELAILDTNTLETENLNVTLGEGGLHTNPPIWSPDGNYLLLYDSINQSTILVDRENRVWVNLANGVAPEGWMLVP